MSTPLRRHILRQATADAHAALERAIGPIRSLEAYRRFCRAAYAFRQPLEQAIAASGPATRLDGFEPLLIADALRMDLQDLDAWPAPAGWSPPISDTSSLLGALYVLEGASLGARLLIRDAAALGVAAAEGLATDAASARSALTLLLGLLRDVAVAACDGDPRLLTPEQAAQLSKDCRRLLGPALDRPRLIERLDAEITIFNRNPRLTIEGAVLALGGQLRAQDLGA